MNSNKGAVILNRIFHVCFFVCMAVTFIGTFFFGYIKAKETHADENGKTVVDIIYYSPKVYLLIYVGAVLMAVMFCALYVLSKRDIRCLRPSNKLSSEAKFRLILFGTVGLMLVIQLYFGAKLKIYPSNDLNHVAYNAASFGETGSFQTARDYISTGHNYYMARYPNNFAIMMILALQYRIWYLVFGYIPLYLPVVVNCIAVSASVLFTVLIAKRMWGRRKAVFTLILLFLFAPFYVYVPFYYTDTMSMPFGIIGIYLILVALQTEKESRIRKYALLVVAGMLLFVGFKVKGSIGVIFAAALVYALLKHKMKEFACIALALIMGFGSFALMFKTGYKAVGLVTEKQADQYEYPYTHWLMMGLRGLGGYNGRDSAFTDSIEGKAEKQEANIKVIKERLNNYLEQHRLTEHFVRKAIWTWIDGTYFIPGHIRNYVKRCFLHEFFLRDGKYYHWYYGYSNAYQLVLLFMMAMSLLKGIIKSKINFMVLIKGAVFGLFLFLLIWESRSRYLYNMTPLYILMAVDGISFTVDFAKKLVGKIRKKPELSEESGSSDTEPIPTES